MSKKSVSALVGGMGLAMSIITSLAQKAKAKGLSDEDFHLLAKPDGEPMLDRLVQMMVNEKDRLANIFRVTVDYTKTLAEMIAAGKYDDMDWVIKPESFLHDTRAPEEVEIHLVHLGREAQTAEVLAELDRMGLRPAILQELLALGAAHPELQRKFWIVALNSGWRIPIGCVSISLLGMYNYSVRGLSLLLCDPDRRWASDYRFAAVRK